MKTSTAIGVIIGAIVLITSTILLETWLLGIILSWFGVSLTFSQNFTIIALVNMIFNNFGISSK
jgi:hypothetical protein